MFRSLKTASRGLWLTRWLSGVWLGLALCGPAPWAAGRRPQAVACGGCRAPLRCRGVRAGAGGRLSIECVLGQPFFVLHSLERPPIGLHRRNDDHYTRHLGCSHAALLHLAGCHTALGGRRLHLGGCHTPLWGCYTPPSGLPYYRMEGVDVESHFWK